MRKTSTLIGAVILLFAPLDARATKVADIAAAFFPTAWRTCSTDVECTTINYGCGGKTAANKKHEKEATKMAYEKGGDPRAMNCLHAAPIPTQAKCLEKLCSLVTGK